MPVLASYGDGGLWVDASEKQRYLKHPLQRTERPIRDAFSGVAAFGWLSCRRCLPGEHGARERGPKVHGELLRGGKAGGRVAASHDWPRKLLAPHEQWMTIR